jgi:hypothetical protein
MAEAIEPDLAPILRHDLAEVSVIRVGTTMELPPGVTLIWARFAATVSSPAGDASIVDVLPSLVATADSAAAPIEVEDDGRLSRERAEDDPRPGFWPYIVGFSASPQTACWDFLPHNGRLPPAAGRLLFSVRDLRGADIFVLRQFHVRVHHPASGEIGLTLIDETRDWTAG